MNADDNFLLKVISATTGYTSLVDCDATQYLEICSTLDNQRLLLCCIPVLLKYVPRSIAQMLSSILCEHRAIMNRHLANLSRFASLANRENLCYAVIKGMALSKVLYADEFARQSEDLDIIVHPDDISKADYVARHADWLQPTEAHRIRRAINTGLFDNRQLLDNCSRYPIRSNPFLPHFTNYFYVDASGQISSLEIHDRFYGLSSRCTPALLANLHSVMIGSKDYPALSPAAQALLSVLSLYENAESLRANTSCLESYSAKACVDVRRWLDMLDADDVSELKILIESFNCGHRAAIALGACCSLFPDAKKMAIKITEPMPSFWSMPYSERIFNPVAATDSGVQDFLTHLVKLISNSHPTSIYADGKLHHLRAPCSRPTSAFQFSCLSKGVHKLLIWEVSRGFNVIREDLAFQVVLLPYSCDKWIPPIRVDVVFLKGEWCTSFHRVEANSIDSHAGIYDENSPARVQYVVAGDETVKIEVELDWAEVDFYSIPSVHQRISGSIFRIVAGCVLTDFEEAVIFEQPFYHAIDM